MAIWHLENSGDGAGTDYPKAVLTRKKTTCILKERTGGTPVLKTKYEAAIIPMIPTRKRWSRTSRSTQWPIARGALSRVRQVCLRPNAWTSVIPLVLKKTQGVPLKAVRLKAARGNLGGGEAAHYDHFKSVEPAKKVRMTPVRDRLKLTSKLKLKRSSAIASPKHAIAPPKRAAPVLRNSSHPELKPANEKRVFTSVAPGRLDLRSQNGSEATAPAQQLSSTACPPQYTSTPRARFATSHSMPAKTSHVAVTTSLQRRAVATKGGRGVSSGAAVVRSDSAPAPCVILPSNRAQQKPQTPMALRDKRDSVDDLEVVKRRVYEGEEQIPPPANVGDVGRKQSGAANSQGRVGATNKAGRAMPLIDMLVGHLSGGWNSTDASVSRAAVGGGATPRSVASSTGRVVVRPTKETYDPRRIGTNARNGEGGAIRMTKEVAAPRVSEPPKKRIIPRAPEEADVQSSARERPVERAMCNRSVLDARQKPGVDDATRVEAGGRAKNDRTGRAASAYGERRMKNGRMGRSESAGGERRVKNNRMGRAASGGGKRVTHSSIGRSASGGGKRVTHSRIGRSASGGGKRVTHSRIGCSASGDGERRVIRSRIGRSASADREKGTEETRRGVRDVCRREEKKRVVERAAEKAKAPLGAGVTRYGGTWKKNGRRAQWDDGVSEMEDEWRRARDVRLSQTEVSVRSNKVSQSKVHPRDERKREASHPKRSSMVESECSLGEDHRSRSARKRRIASRVIRTYNNKDLPGKVSKRHASRSISTVKSETHEEVRWRKNENKRTGEHTREVNDDMRRRRRSNMSDEDKHTGRTIRGRALAEERHAKYTLARKYDANQADTRKSSKPRALVPGYKGREASVSDSSVRGRSRRGNVKDNMDSSRNRKRVTISEDVFPERKSEKRRRKPDSSEEREPDKIRKKIRGNERTGAKEGKDRTCYRTYSLVSDIGSSEPKDKASEMDHRSHGFRKKDRADLRKVVSSDDGRASRKGGNHRRAVDGCRECRLRQKSSKHQKKTDKSDSDESEADAKKRRKTAGKRARARTTEDKKLIKHTRSDHAVSDSVRKRRARDSSEDQSPPKDSKKRKERQDTSVPVRKSRDESPKRAHVKNAVTVKHSARRKDSAKDISQRRSSSPAQHRTRASSRNASKGGRNEASRSTRPLRLDSSKMREKLARRKNSTDPHAKQAVPTPKSKPTIFKRPTEQRKRIPALRSSKYHSRRAPTPSSSAAANRPASKKAPSRAQSVSPAHSVSSLSVISPSASLQKKRRRK